MKVHPILDGPIGLTPLKGMAEYATYCKLPIPVRLVYSKSQRGENPVPRRERAALESINPNSYILHTIARLAPGSWKGRTGRIGLDLLAEVAAGFDLPMYYLCGAPGFIEACYPGLVASGVAEADTRFGLFRGYGASA